MEEMHENETTPNQENYFPRPAWQVWSARVALVLFIGFVIYQILSIATGGIA